MTSRIESAPASSAAMRSQPNAMPPCGGGPYANASSRKPNFSCASSGAQPHDVEHALLHVAAVDTDRAAADLVAVADDVVGVGERVARVLLEPVDPLRLRRGERVVHRGPGARAHRDVGARRTASNIGASTTQTNAQRVLVDQAAPPADLEPGGTEQGTASAPARPAAKKTRRRPRRRPRRRSRRALGVGQVLRDRTGELPVVADQDVRQAARAARLRPLLPARRAPCRAAWHRPA